MLIFNQRVDDTKYIFVLEDNTLNVCKYYNGHGLRYTHELNSNETIAELARLVEMFKQMPDEMWDIIEHENIKCK